MIHYILPLKTLSARQNGSVDIVCKSISIAWDSYPQASVIFQIYKTFGFTSRKDGRFIQIKHGLVAKCNDSRHLLSWVVNSAEHLAWEKWPAGAKQQFSPLVTRYSKEILREHWFASQHLFSGLWLLRIGHHPGLYALQFVRVPSAVGDVEGSYHVPALATCLRRFKKWWKKWCKEEMFTRSKLYI